MIDELTQLIDKYWGRFMINFNVFYYDIIDLLDNRIVKGEAKNLKQVEERIKEKLGINKQQEILT